MLGVILRGRQMTVKEIIKLTATLLSREDVKRYANGEVFSPDSDTKKAVDILVELLNLVINELSLSYVPMVKSESINVAFGKVNYSSLKERALRIIDVLDANGQSLDFCQKAEHFETSDTAKIVKYSYIPNNYSFEEQIGYSEKDIPVRCLAYGLSAEFCLTEGEFDQAVLFHGRYIDALKEICLPKNGVCKKRSWR